MKCKATTTRKKNRATSLIEMLCVIGLFSLITSLTAPLFRDIIIKIPQMNTVANEHSYFIDSLNTLRSDIETAKTVTLADNKIILTSPDDTRSILSCHDGKFSYTRESATGDVESLFAKDMVRTDIEILPFPVESPTPLAVNLRISDIIKKQPNLKTKQPFNFLIFLKEGQYATKN